MFSTVVTVCLISIILPLILKSEDEKDDNYDRVLFKFSKKIRLTMLISTIIFIIILVFATITVVFNNDKSALSALVIFSMFTLLSSILYILTRNKKILYTNDKLYAYNILGKKSSFNVSDIKEAIENPSDGMKLIFKDGRKLKVDIQMTNYSKIKEILEKNNIIYKDKHGNDVPKGW